MAAEKIMVGKTEYWLVHTTAEGFQILVSKGSLSRWDYRIKYRKPSTRYKSGYTIPRMPKHIHVVVELYAKYAKNPKLTLKLLDYFVSLLDKVRPVNYFPPKLKFFNKRI